MNPNRREILVRKRIFIENNIRNVNQICPTRVNPCSNNNRPLKFNRVRVTPTHFDPFGSFGTARICRKIDRDSTKATRIDPSGARFRRATIAVELQKPRNYENGLSNPIIFQELPRSSSTNHHDRFRSEGTECEFAADRGITRAHVVIRGACAELRRTPQIRP